MAQTINALAAAALLSGQRVDVVDVRDEHEWATGHLPGSRLIPLDQLRADPDAVLSRDSIILFVCAKGVRSLTAAKLAERLGYTNVYNLEGGTLQWARSGLSLVTEQRVAA